ncbi:MAG TPA: helix-turn-helix transcriptional regulator [Solirubrobacteraceae bacterium]|nr:helix-turn-helix transcriptional regulator [Solirubrobacteraceae bacterium]
MGAPALADVELAAEIRRLRLLSGESQESLAHRSGLTVAALSRIERGAANPAWTTVRRIMGALEVSLSELGERLEAA